MSKALKRTLIVFGSVVLVVGLCFGGFVIYASDFYHADEKAIAAFSENDGVMVTEVEDGILTFGQCDWSKGFIFYPGGKVEYTSYAPFMRKLASEGIFCVLIEMPFNLAVLDVNAADSVLKRFQNVDEWYIGGHSLGGSMAANYLSDNAEDFCGLVLLGAYSTSDISETDLKVLSVYGSEYGVMNRKKYDGNLKNLPNDFVEHVIDGANHAGFGMYGKQKGDGTASVTNEEQILITVEIIKNFIL